jgi:hypothetical protein
MKSGAGNGQRINDSDGGRCSMLSIRLLQWLRSAVAQIESTVVLLSKSSFVTVERRREEIV